VLVSSDERFKRRGLPVQTPLNSRSVVHALVQIHGPGRKVGEQGRNLNTTGPGAVGILGSVDRPLRTWALEIATERAAGAIVLVPKGRIGSVTAGAFAEAVSAARAAAPRLVIDLTGVDYISGAGIKVLQKVGSNNGARTIVCGLHEAVRITLELAGALDGVVVVEDRKAAIEKC
jgi:anti-sigma B factor antagonist